MEAVEQRKKLFEVKGLKTQFTTEAGVATAVNGVDFDIYEGEVLGLVGESGCGKSVTAMSMVRLIPNPPGEIVAGEVWHGGRDLLKLSYEDLHKVRGKEVAMIFQEPMTSLNPVFTIGYQVREILMLHEGLDKKAADVRAAEMLSLVGIPDAEKRLKDYPHQFSGGMRQRAMIAMALACNPALLVADEPTTALDVTIQAQILDLVLALQEEMGMAVLFISHNLAVIGEVADEVAVMYAGRIVEAAASDELFGQPLHPYTRGLIETLPGPRGRQGNLPTIPGAVPDLRRLPRGCRYSDRCPLGDEGCRGADPPVTEPVQGHRVACYKAAP